LAKNHFLPPGINNRKVVYILNGLFVFYRNGTYKAINQMKLQSGRRE